MPESAKHAFLVRAILQYVEREFGNIADIGIREDALHPVRGERPPMIEGYVPDVYVIDVPSTRTLIGEAKTRQDIETEHSMRQISAFLRYLSETPNGVFVLSVPLVAGPTARRVLSEANREYPEASTQTVVLDCPVSAEW